MAGNVITGMKKNPKEVCGTNHNAKYWYVCSNSTHLASPSPRLATEFYFSRKKTGNILTVGLWLSVLLQPDKIASVVLLLKDLEKVKNGNVLTLHLRRKR